MTDLSSLLTVSGNHLFLNNWTDRESDVEDIKSCVRTYGQGFSLYSDDFYRFLVEKWRGALRRYPVAYKGQPLLIYLRGMVNMIPYIMLPELIPLYHELYRTIAHRKRGTRPPFIGGFVKNGDRILEIFGDPDIHGELAKLIKCPPERIRKEKTEQSSAYYARRPGYVIVTTSGLDIISPLRIEEDKSSLAFLMLPIVEGYEDRIEYFREYMQKHRTGYPGAPEPKDRDYLQAIRNMDSYSYDEYEILRGEIPVAGYDSRLEFPLERETSDRDRDRVNFHDYSGIVIVPEGQIFARKVRHREGVDGLDIYGSKITVAKGRDISITVEGDIRAEEQGEFIFFRAVTTGIAQLDGTKLVLKESLFVEGHVDYHTGNIKFNGDVIIKGDVKSGFSVIAGGNIIIEGSVENGSHVRASEELRIKQGIIGQDTVVESGKDLRCGFIQNSRVSCRNSIHVEKNITGARVYCRGSLMVEGKGLARKRIGVVNGSDCSSFQGMTLLSAGSELNETILRIGYDLFIEEKIREMEEVHSTYELKTRQIMNALPEDIGNVEKIKKLPPEKRAAIVETLKKLKGVNEKMRQFEIKKEKMAEFLYNRDEGSLSIRLEEGFKAPVVVQIGETKELMPVSDGKQELVLHGDELTMIRG